MHNITIYYNYILQYCVININSQIKELIIILGFEVILAIIIENQDLLPEKVFLNTCGYLKEK